MALMASAGGQNTCTMPALRTSGPSRSAADSGQGRTWRRSKARRRCETLNPRSEVHRGPGGHGPICGTIPRQPAGFRRGSRRWLGTRAGRRRPHSRVLRPRVRSQGHAAAWIGAGRVEAPGGRRQPNHPGDRSGSHRSGRTGGTVTAAIMARARKAAQLAAFEEAPDSPLGIARMAYRSRGSKV